MDVLDKMVNIYSVFFLDDFQCLKALLGSTDVVVAARASGMMGNLLRHSDQFYAVLKSKPEVMRELLACLSSEDADVRKVCRVSSVVPD